MLVVVFMLLTATTAWAWSGQGTETSPYQIRSTNDLNQLATDVNGGNEYADTYFVLTADITYITTGLGDTGSNYTPIGGRFNGTFWHFKGHFDGQNHTVSGIRIYKSGSDFEDCNQALFGRIDNGATVKNVFLADARITGYRSSGGIVGNATGNSTVENCHVLSDVTIHVVAEGKEGVGNCCGGIAGHIYQSTVTGCTSAASITIATNVSISSDYGGIVGQNSESTVTDCIYFGSTVEGRKAVGAIVGRSSSNSTVSNCYYTSTTIQGKDIYGNALDNNASAIGHIVSNATNTATVDDARLITSADFAQSGDTLIKKK